MIWQKKVQRPSSIQVTFQVKHCISSTICSSALLVLFYPPKLLETHLLTSCGTEIEKQCNVFIIPFWPLQPEEFIFPLGGVKNVELGMLNHHHHPLLFLLNIELGHLSCNFSQIIALECKIRKIRLNCALSISVHLVPLKNR